jgi:hypothetical protein
MENYISNHHGDNKNVFSFPYIIHPELYSVLVDALLCSVVSFMLRCQQGLKDLVSNMHKSILLDLQMRVVSFLISKQHVAQKVSTNY